MIVLQVYLLLGAIQGIWIVASLHFSTKFRKAVDDAAEKAGAETFSNAPFAVQLVTSISIFFGALFTWPLIWLKYGIRK